MLRPEDAASADLLAGRLGEAPASAGSHPESEHLFPEKKSKKRVDILNGAE